jgi:hypothetical protein
MRNVKTALITLAASAAILIPAGSAAAATTQSTSAAASSSLSSTTSSLACVALCFNLYDNDVLTGNDVDIITTVSFCGIQAAQLQVLSIGQTITCVDGHKKVKRTK